MQIIEMNVAEIVPYKNNPRDNEAAVMLVANSIKEFGFKVPVLITADNEIVAGHTRVLAAKRLGMETVPCIRCEDLTDEQIRAYRLADNKTAEAATWNEELLAQELDAILDLDMSLFGFDLEDDTDEDMEDEEDQQPEIPFTEELLEENNYVVLFFDNSIDWLQAQSVLGISQAKALDSKEGFQRVGTGRVIDGTKFIERLMRDEN